MAEKLPHIRVIKKATTKIYTAPSSGGGSKLRLNARDRQFHGAHLLEGLRQAQAQESEIVARQKASGRDAGSGVYLQFESDHGFELAFESLAFARSGIELLAVKHEAGRMLATVFVPEGKIGYFIRKIEAYLDETKDTTNRKGERSPKNKTLVESIAQVRLAVLEGLWTDPPELFPRDEQAIWWEVWLRCGEGFDEVAFFRRHAQEMGMEVGGEEVHFLERCVLLVRTTRAQLSRSLHVMLGIAELRLAKDSADFYTAMNPVEQHEWIANAAEKLQPPEADAPAVCVLDTGVNHEHPLLVPYVADEDRHACYPHWLRDDHDGHGSGMAGLALHGDLSVALGEAVPAFPTHRVESVKVLPPVGNNPPHLYGSLYREAIARVEIQAPQRRRVICSAVTTTDSRDRGRPSSWSAQLDKIASGMEDGTARLVFQAAGNCDRKGIPDYPDSNALDEIHDPGQAWNTLTVGAYTEKWQIDKTVYPGREVIAEPGALAPTSCTAVGWPIRGRQKWPNKPDIVMEGGNWALDTVHNFAEDLDSLQLLTTGHQPLKKPLVTFGETSAATALAARMAAILQNHYPDLWPETLRALIVHSAQWTPAMERTVADPNRKSDIRQLLRTCGFGVPDLGNALWSAHHSLTLVVQDEMRPYAADEKDGHIRTRDIHFHDFPWPTEVLRDLGETPVEMRVTLSYFVEPNPGQRGWSGRFNYASHGLRFRVKTPEESRHEFEQRINQSARDEEYERQGSSDNDFWTIGSDTRELGSLHSDIWQGTAAQLADSGYLAVYPVTGWWRTRKALDRWHSKARYALAVSIRTPEEVADIYTPVAAAVGVEIKV